MDVGYKYQEGKISARLLIDQDYFHLRNVGVNNRIIKIESDSLEHCKIMVTWFFISNLYEFWSNKDINLIVQSSQYKRHFIKIEEIARWSKVSKLIFQKTLSEGAVFSSDLATSQKLVLECGFPKDKFLNICALTGHVNLYLLCQFLLMAENIVIPKKEIIDALLEIGEMLRKKNSSVQKNKYLHLAYSLTKEAIEFRFVHNDTIIYFDIVSFGKKVFNANFLDKNRYLNRMFTVEKSSFDISQIGDLVLSKMPSLTESEKDAYNASTMHPLNQLYKSCHLEYKGLVHLAKVVNPDHLVQLANGVYQKQKEKFLRTVLKINGCMEKYNWKNIFGDILIYKKGSDDCFPFAINGNTAIIVHEKIGAGTFKIASSAYVLNTLEKIVELVVINDKIGLEKIIAEKKLLERISENNPYLMPPYECLIKKKNKIVMFQSYFDSDGKKLSAATPLQLLIVFRDIASGLAKMHQEGYVHSDVKPANFFLRGNLGCDEKIESRIGDLGMATKFNSPLLGGSIFYFPPEIFSNKTPHACPKFDSYSLGVSLFEILRRAELSRIPATFSELRLKREIKAIREEIQANKIYFIFEKVILLTLLECAEDLLAFKSEKRASCQSIASKLSIACTELVSGIENGYGLVSTHGMQ